MGYLILLVALVALGFFLLHPAMKGYRTQAFGLLTVAGGAIVPLATQVFEYLQTLDWRQYVLDGDKKNLVILGVTAGLGVMVIVLRYMTTGPVGQK